MDGRSWSITTTVDTRDAVALEEVGRMHTRLAARAALAEGAPEQAEETALVAAERTFGGFQTDAIADAAVMMQPILAAPPAVDAATAFQAAAPVAELPAPSIDASAAFSQAPVPGTLRTDCGNLRPGTIFCTTFGEREDGCGTCSAFTPLAPVVAVAPPAPAVAPPAAPAPAVSGPVLDTDGLPWDARINTSNKVTRKDGVWKRVPGITDELYTGVIAELKAAMGAPSPAEILAAAIAPPAATPTPAAPPVPAGEEAVPATFTDLIACVTKRTGSIPPKITPDEVNAACAIISGGAINNLALLINRADLIPTAYAEMKKIWDTRA